METTSASGAQVTTSSRSAPIQWLGVQWQGGFYSVPLTEICAVFRAEHTEHLAEKKILDIEIHAGAAVFVKPFPTCFDLSPFPQDMSLDEERRWVVVLNSLGHSQIGCRVHQVVGPFWADALSMRVLHAGRDWVRVHPCDVTDA